MLSRAKNLLKFIQIVWYEILSSGEEPEKFSDKINILKSEREINVEVNLNEGSHFYIRGYHQNSLVEFWVPVEVEEVTFQHVTCGLLLVDEASCRAWLANVEPYGNEICLLAKNDKPAQ